MARSSIGQFIAALRKANGMTQQDVADRLNVSNKAVSRWERDECAPDLSVIPALAEMFGVTCDELLKGERIFDIPSQEKKEPKVEKQLRNLINRILSGFKTLIWISLAVAAVGAICMFGISYGFYRPVIGFAVMLLFEACALVLSILAVSRTKYAKEDNELFEYADEAVSAKFNRQLSSFSFASFFTIFSVIFLSLPLIISSDPYGVLSFESYIFGPFWIFTLALILIFFSAKDRYTAWITGQPYSATSRKSSPAMKKMTLLQLGTIAISCILFIISPYFNSDPYSTPILTVAINLMGLLLLISNIISFTVIIIRHRDERKQLLLPGIRNMLLTVPCLLVSEVHYVGFSYYGKEPTANVTYAFERYDSWASEYLLYAIASALIITVVFKLIDVILRKKEK